MLITVKKSHFKFGNDFLTQNLQIYKMEIFKVLLCYKSSDYAGYDKFKIKNKHFIFNKL